METSHQVECLETLTKELQSLQNKRYILQESCNLENVQKTNQLLEALGTVLDNLNGGLVTCENVETLLVDLQYDFLKLSCDMLVFCNKNM